MEEKQKEKINTKKKTSKVLMFILILALLCVGIIFINPTARQSILNRMNGNIENANENSVTESNAGITAVGITNTVTGTAPFDNNDEPGNDSSASNDIVRSFDKVTWRMDITMDSKDGQPIKESKIQIQATIPESIEDAKWDLDTMNWIENAAVSEDGRTLTGSYTVEGSTSSTSLVQALEFVMELEGAKNGTEISPTFVFNIEGDDETREITTPPVKVSSTGKYNVKLINAKSGSRTTVDYGEGEIRGRMYPVYGFAIQLYNESTEKGLKGIEYPKGEISFDIDLTLERALSGSDEREDITAEATPVLWNYRVNNDYKNSAGEIDGRDMYIGDYTQAQIEGQPKGIDNGDRSWSTYNSGNIKMVQEGNKLHVTVNNYDFDGEFPHYTQSYESNPSRYKVYGDNVGLFSIVHFQVFVPDTEASTQEGYDYYLTVEDNNARFTSLSDDVINEQKLTTDDSYTINHALSSKGRRTAFIDYNQFTDAGRKGNAAAIQGQGFTTRLTFVTDDADPEYYTYSQNYIYKFDGSGLEPASDEITYKVYNTNMQFNAYYLTKKDGSNWTSQEEMNKTVELDDFNVYKNKSDIPEGYTCIGVFFESIDGGVVGTGYCNIHLNMKIKEDAKVNQVYGMTFAIRQWTQDNKLDRTIYTVENKNITSSEYPEPYWKKEGQNYVKTIYDENGNITKGHSNYYEGNCILVMGANLSGDVRAVDSSGNEKTTYDLAKNENTITYSVEPKIDGNEYKEEQTSNITLKAEVTLPSGLEYVPGSSKRGEENYSEPQVTKNSNGTTTLVWYLYNCTAGEDIVPITFDANIDNTTLNETQYQTKFVISEYIGDGEAKIGNSSPSSRTSTNTITVVNLGSHRLYQEVITPIVETNGEIKYRITYQNTSGSATPDFQVLDILPFNGDGRGTNYNGTYTLKDIKVTQTNSNTEIPTDNLSLFITTNIDAREITPKDEGIGVSDIWEQKEIGSQINEPATVIALKGEVEAGTTVVMEITLKTTNNRGEDTYYNVATAQTNKDTDVMTTTALKAEVVSREISGMVWYDTNENGTKEDSESYAQGIEVELLNSDGTKAKDTSGNEIANQLTTANGEYEFINLTRNDYIVRIVTDNKYKLTTANIGTNKEINSKFEEVEGNKQSYVITNLNGVQSPVMIEDNVNAGLVVKDAKIVINYLEEDNTPDDDSDNNVLRASEEITQYEKDGVMANYKIGDTYSTEAVQIDNYIVLRNSGNTTGTLDSEVEEVTYYYTYNKQDINIRKVWDDDNDAAGKRPTSIKVELKNGNNVIEEVILSDDNANSSDANIWEETINNLDIYNEDGQKINYTVDEKENEGSLESYNKMINGTTITNTFTQNTEKIDVKVNKLWDDSNDEAVKRPKEVTIILKQEVVNGGESSYQEVERATINGNDNPGDHVNEWSYTFDDVAKFDKYNNEIKYTVEEVIPEFYTSYVENVENENTLIDNLEFNIRNTFSVPDEKINVTVSKVWDDNNNRAGKRPTNVTLVLTGKNKEGNQVGEAKKVTLTSANAIAGSENTWQGTISDLPKYDEKADEINYELSEESLNSVFYTEENTTINQGTKTITNRFVVPSDTIEVDVSKIWEDNNNEQNARPESVTLILRGNSQEYSTVLTSANTRAENGNVWRGTITGLPKYNVNGDEIEYILDERPVDSIFYTKTNVDQQNKTVTNRFNIPTESIQVTATKVWKDNNNALGKRPQAIELQIINKETKEVVESQIMQGNSTTNDGWSYTFEVPKYGDTTEEIEYEIGEKELGNEFYTTNVDQETRTITNTFEVPDVRIEVPVTKVWDDNSNFAGKRPRSITLILKSSTGTEYIRSLSSYDVVEGNTNSWSNRFVNLPKYDSVGNEITYTLSEEPTGSIFYTAENTSIIGNTTEGYTVTNTFEVPSDTVEVPVTKVWDDNSNVAGKRPLSVTVKLTGSDGQEYTKELNISNEANDVNTWTYTFTELPKYNSVGNEITYTLSEEPTGSIFYVEANADITGNMTEGYVVTNTFEVPDDKVSVDVSKVWIDTEAQQDKRPTGVTVVLKNGEEESGRKELNNTDGWSYTFSNLAKYDSLGNEINYTVEEVTTNKFYTSSTSGNMVEGYVITNTFTRPEETTEITVNKVWDDNSDEAGKRPDSVTLKVTGNGDTYTQEVTGSGDRWSYTFTELPKYDANGDEIEYTVDEEELTENSEFYLKSVNQETDTVTNTFNVPGENITVKATKAWDDNENVARKRPTSVTLQVKDGEDIVVSEIANEENNWTVEFEVPKYDNLGNEINYTVDEADLGSIFYTKANSEVTGNMTEGYTVSNTFEVPDDTIEVPVTKIWDDNSNVASKRPTSVTVKLIGSDGTEKTQELTVANEVEGNTNSWTYTFTGLRKYDSIGDEIAYTLSEEPTGSIFYTEENTEITGNMTEGYTVTNTFVVPDDTVEVSVTKVWDDNSNVANKRPTSVTVKLTGSDGKEYTKELNISNEVNGDVNTWTYTFTELPKYNSVGDEITYALSEEPTESIFYTEENSEISGDMKSGYTIINRFVVPDDKVSIDVSKVWVDTAEQKDKRPTGVTVVLKNGEEEAGRKELNNTDGWSYTFSNLAKYDNLGNEINYAVEEITTNKFYTSSISGDMKSGYVITNTFTRPEEITEITVNKLWDDNSDEAGKRPDSVTLKVTGNGDTYTQEVTGSGDRWSYTFTELPKYDANGDEIEYTVDEEELTENSEFYLKSVNQETDTVTNTFNVPGDKVTVKATKSWDDNENVAGKRSESVTIQVKDGDRIVASEEANEENSWTVEIDVPKYNSLGNEIEYTVDEADLGNIFYTKENSEVTGDMTNGYTVTNRFVVPDEKVEVPITKIWDDNSNFAGKRPISVTVKLTGSDGQEYTQELNNSNAVDNNINVWTYTFTGLPKYDSVGDEITYTLSEEPTESIFYTVQNTVVDQESMTITNKFEVPDDTIEVPVTKVWDDNSNVAGKRPLSVTVKLTGSDGQEYTKELNISNEVNGDVNTWTYTFTELPKYDSIGNEITYTLSEDPTESIFYTAENTDITGNMTEGYVVTNTFEVPDDKVSVDVSKVWIDTEAQQDKRPTGVTVVLKNGEEEAGRKELNNTDGWSYTFSNLAKYDSLGNEINYTVEEVTTNKFYTSSTSGNMVEGYVITNTFTRPEETTEITVNKVWDDNSDEAGKRPDSVTLKVTGNGDTYTQEVTGSGDRWSYTFTELPKYDANGDEIEYTVDEEELTENSEFYLKSVNQETDTVTNTFNVPGENITVKATKAWDDNENVAGKRPESVTIQVKDGDRIVATEEANEENNWTVEIDVPKYDALGNEISYTVDEADLGNIFYTKENSEVTGDMKSGYTVTNTFEVPNDTIEIPVTKVWDDNSNFAGKRPISVTVKLTGSDGTEKEQELNNSHTVDNNINVWTYTFTELPKYDSLGNEVVYTLNEENVDSIFYTEQNTVVDQESKTVTNTFEVPGDTIEVPVTKVWDDNSNVANKRPTSVTVKLTGSDGKEYTKELNISNEVNGDVNTWTYTFTELPKYNSVGDEITYALSEEPTESIFYTEENSEISGDMKSGYTIINRFVVPDDKVSIDVSKVWVDTAEQQDKRPTGVTVVLKNGEEEAGRKELNNTDGWSYTFSNLAKYDSLGNEINYTVEEATTNKFYTSSISGDMDSGYVITNTFQVPDEKVEVPVTKVWNDNSNVAGKRPTSVTVKLTGSDGTEKTQKLTIVNVDIENTDNWTYTFKELSKYDSNGDEINYTLSEEPTESIFYTEENSEISGDMKSGYTIINRFVVPDDKVSIDVSKVWVDTAEQKDKRPTGVTVVLKNGEEESGRKELNNTDGWSYTFSNLAKYDSLGNEINYTVEEVTTNKFYTSSTSGNMVEGYVITNTFTRPEETTEITVNKVWDDNSDEAGKRPDSVTLKVTGNGDTYTQEVTGSGDRWSYTFTELPKYDANGDEIEYTVDEEELTENSEFYLKSVNQETDTVTNTFNVPGENITVKATKSWDDNEDVAGKRPESVTIQVKDGDRVVASEEANEENNWTVEIDVPKYDALGNEISYTVDEADLGNIFYTKENSEVTGDMKSGYTVTNTFEVPNDTIEIPVTKVWDDNSNFAGKRPTSITLKLTGSDGQEYTQELNAEGNEVNTWTYIFTGLPKYDSVGNEITYTLSEEPTGSIFYTEENADITGDMTSGYTITNRFVVPDEKVEVPVTKVWDDNSNEAGKRPTSVTVKLTGSDGQEYTKELNISNEVNGDVNTWTYTFTELPKYNSVGDEITYALSEEPTESIFYTEENSEISGDMKSGYTIINRFVVPDDKVSIDVSKVWVDTAEQQDKRPTGVTVVLKNGEEESGRKELNNTDGWSYTFSNLAKYDSLGNEINYTVEEVTTNKFYTSSTSGNMVEGYVITNTFTRPEETTEITVNKVWDDNSDEAGKRPDSVTLKVTGNGDTYTQEVTGSGDRWSYTFTELPKYDANGDEIEYTVDEEELTENSEFYLKSVNQETDTVTNTFNVPGENIIVKATKSWDDNEDVAGKRPESVTIQVKDGDRIVASEEANEENSWTVEIEVPKYNSLGNEIVYTVDEADLRNKFYIKENSEVTGDMESGYTVTNKFEVPDEKVSVNVSKVWMDTEAQQDKRPSSVTVAVKNGETEVERKELNATNGWKETFTDLAKYDSLGNEINYTVEEVTTNEFYTYTGATGDMESGYVITNTFTRPEETTEVTVNKYWNDNNNLAGKRPTSVTLKVTGNDETYTQEVTGNGDTWTYTFTGLPKYDENGNVINYTVDEEDVGSIFYEKEETILGDMTSGYTITNTFVVPDEKVSVDVSKAWVDTEAQQDKRPSSVTVAVKNGETEVERKELNATNGWKETFTDLAKYDSLGNEINYTVEEITTNKFYTYTGTTGDMESGYVITNTFTRPTDTINVIANKVWADTDEQASRRPSSVTLVVKNGETEVESKVITSDNLVTGTTNQWTIEFTELDKYDSNGDEIEYTLEERETDSGDLKFYEVEENNVEFVDNQATIRNNFVVPDDTTQVTVTKVWNDNNDTNGRRPESIVLKVIGNGQEYSEVVTEKEGWAHTFTDLPKYDANGKEIVYTASEEEVNNGDLKFYKKASVRGDMTSGYTVVNTFTVPEEKVELTVNKVWEDNTIQSERRPESIALKVTGNGQEYIEVVTEEEGWAHTFTDLPKYDASGKEIVYTVSEEEVNSGDLKFYTSSVGTVTNLDENSKQVTITNKFVKPDDTTDVTVTKVWDDNSNFAEKRPEGVKLLLKDGTETIGEQVVSSSNEVSGDSNRWNYTFTGVAKYDDNGQEKVYTVDETEVNGGDLQFYNKNVNGLTVTNVFTQDISTVDIPVTKVWEDNDIQEQRRPAGVIIVLKANGEEKARQKITGSGDTWNYTFEDLPKYDEYNNIINYTIEEEELNSGDLKFYTSRIDGYTITNTFTRPTDTVSLTVYKIWEDQRNIYNKRPDQIKVIVNDSKGIVTTGLVSKNNKWTGVINNLAKYDENGQEITYTVAEEEVSEGSLFYYEGTVGSVNKVSENKLSVAITNKMVRIPGTVTVKYIDKSTGLEISDAVIKEGIVGDTFDITEDEREIEGYTLIERPEEMTGEYTTEAQELVYYYAKNTNVVVKYLEKDNTPEDNTDNVKLAEEVEIPGYEGLEYNVDDKKLKIEGYTLVSNSGNLSGKMERDGTEVIYYYAKNTTVTVKYVERDNVANELAEEQIISGYEGLSYDTSDKKLSIEGYTLVGNSENVSGIMTEEGITVTYYYAKNTNVIVKYLEKDDTASDTDNKELIPDIKISGYVGKDYETEQKQLSGYTFVEVKGETTGTMTEDQIVVVYYYAQNTSVKVEHIDRETNEVLAEETITGKVGDVAYTQAKDIEGYVLVEAPSNPNVTMTKNEQVVRYYYAHISGGVIEKHIDEITGNVIEQKLHEGNEGDTYKINSKEFAGYDLVTDKLPTNSSGTMLKDEVIEVKYYYIKKAKVVISYVDKDTGEKIAQDEEITGHEGDSYAIEGKDISGYNIVENSGNTSGKMVVTVNEDGTFNIETNVTFYYKKVAGGVVVNHIDIATGEVIESSRKDGNVGDRYETSAEEIPGYDLVIDRLPENSSGEMTEEEIVVNYYYQKQTKVIVQCIDKLTGKELQREEIIGHIGDEYETEEKVFDGYDLVQRPSNETGEMTEEEIVVKYYYRRKAEVEIKYIEKETGYEIAESDLINGYVGDGYEAEGKEVPYYTLIEGATNWTGTMTEEKITVIYYYRKQLFNLGVDMWIGSVNINGISTPAQSISNSDEMYKVDINRNKVDTAIVKVTYTIRITNTGEIEGTVGKVADIIPPGTSYYQEDNNIYWDNNNGILTTDELKDEIIQPGEYKEIEITLRWNIDNYFGQKDNIVMLTEIKNPAGFQDSVREDNSDLSSKLLSIATGLDRNDRIVIIGIVEIVFVIIIGLLLSYDNKGKHMKKHKYLRRIK